MRQPLGRLAVPDVTAYKIRLASKSLSGDPAVKLDYLCAWARRWGSVGDRFLMLRWGLASQLDLRLSFNASVGLGGGAAFELDF